MIPCLSLLQPWATLMAIGAKNIETRSWATKYRGPLAIAASKHFPGPCKTLGIQTPFWEALRVAGYYAGNGAHNLPLGSILCIRDLVDCIPITADNAPPEPERSFGDYSTDPKQRYAWHFADVWVLPEPIPAKGNLGLWTPAPDVLKQLERYLPLP